MTYQYTDFFDYKATTASSDEVVVVNADVSQSIFPGDSGIVGSGASLARVRKVEAWVLPRASNSEIASTSFIAATGVLARTSVDTGAVRLVAVKNTIVNPTFNTKWVKVVNYTTKQVFGDNLAFPLATGSAKEVLELFRIAMLNPDDGDAILNQDFQVMYRVTMAINLPIAVSRNVGVQNVASWISESSGAAAPSFVMAEVKGISHLS